MTQVTRITPLLTATHRYEKTISTFNRGHGQLIDAPILGPEWGYRHRARLSVRLVPKKGIDLLIRAFADAALQAIRKLIKEQGFGPGDALPSQRDLAVQLGVSRASLREALDPKSSTGR